MPKVSIVIPTHNRPELLKEAVESVLNQTYQDFEIIIVDDGLEKRGDEILPLFNDARIFYIKHNEEKGGAAARNTGIGEAKGEFIAFLDDDDEWLQDKLKNQMELFEKSSEDVGFCFSAVKNIYDDKEELSNVPQGVDDYFELALRRPKGFLTSSLIVKKRVFDNVGCFDEKFPSHQEADLMIRIARKYKGIGINWPLVKMNMQNHSHIGGNLSGRIRGRQMLLDKYFSEYQKRPAVLAKHYFWLGIMNKKNKDVKGAKDNFKKAFGAEFKFRYFFHYLTSILWIFRPKT
ncbi:MAG: glycosyltransferase family 2 protein [Candidatus Portnoybacteria bacterium]|nr:glycosyltransferase family 2 protein [Candidatus Portnoybacteria bacterium]